MENIFAIIDIAKTALSLERTQVSVASENIANISSPGYIAKSVNKTAFLELLQSTNAADAMQDVDMVELDSNRFISEDPTKEIRLDREVLDISNAEMRYQAIAQMIKAKLGLLELTIGGKNK
jgi:flagellar basal body rod protein FlgB